MTAVFYLTENGHKLAERISEKIEVKIFGKEQFQGRMKEFVADCFLQFDALIFIMASGIAVRMIAPCLRDKRIDPAVLVIDDRGHYVISLLSGHVGGANALAKKVAAWIEACPVITTATDVNGVIAFDVFAEENQCEILNRELVKVVSSALAEGHRAGLFTDGIVKALPAYLTWRQEQEVSVVISSKAEWEGSFLGKTLWLCPKNLTLGIGCRKGIQLEELEKVIFHFLRENNRRIEGIRVVASIDKKKEEAALLQFCEKRGLPFVTFPAEKMNQIPVSSFSAFVKETVGTGNVCEAAAFLAAEGTKIICKKTAYKGITLALGEILQIWEFHP